MKNYFFNTSLNIISFIIKIIALHNTLNAKNMSILYEFIIKIKSVVFMQR